ncbi:MAG TPA: NADH-ubiquinone oxidoreductase-F iron-sulfur binding region domain-containing protein [Candidatus Binatia bacterium]|nr:NADH-ubiquinone oxidoreductase-F iron-sulfur binding region domain-containing protein [Candidatus Binatia bacterium]
MTGARERADVASFYHLRGASFDDRTCAGTACFVARFLDPDRWRAADRAPRVYCLGKCYAAPAAAADSRRPAVAVASPRPVVLERVADGGARTLAEYTALGGYRALDRALGTAPAAVVAEVERAGLRGRGGAGFPTGRKLAAVAAQPAAPKYVVMNADEGDPGAYVDRILLEDDPHAPLEGLAIAAYAVGATKGWIYLRREYPDALPILERAIADARAAGILGPKLLGRGPAFDVEVVVGLGSYVCGEETALLESIEGRRPFVRPRPPYPSAHGLHGRPTLVQNVETLANVPWIVAHGSAAYAAMGFSRSRGTKVVSLNSLFRRPGLYEVELGTPLRRIVDDLGAGLSTGGVTGVIVGGPLAGVLPPSCFDAPLAFDELAALGASVGHGGVIAFDEHTSIRALVHHVFAFGADESCGRCTPCRLGTRAVADMVAKRSPAAAWDAGRFEAIASALHATSLCGHGTGLGEFARSVLRHYREELSACFASS